MPPDEFVNAYEEALKTQDWTVVEPLVHSRCCAISTNGTAHEGKAAVEAAFTRNFSLIADEEYRITNVRWVEKNDRFAVYLFEFAWSGFIDGQKACGGGCGTCVLVCENGTWQMLVEHLAPNAQ